MAKTPSKLAMVPFVSVDHMMQLVNVTGIPPISNRISAVGNCSTKPRVWPRIQPTG
jgi:hypothetical protein